MSGPDLHSHVHFALDLLDPADKEGGDDKPYSPPLKPVPRNRQELLDIIVADFGAFLATGVSPQMVAEWLETQVFELNPYQLLRRGAFLCEELRGAIENVDQRRELVRRAVRCAMSNGEYGHAGKVLDGAEMVPWFTEPNL